MSHLEYNKIFFYDYKWIFLKIYKNYNKLLIHRYLFLSEIIITIMINLSQIFYSNLNKCVLRKPYAISNNYYYT